jgi:hypothetical protein
MMIVCGSVCVCGKEAQKRSNIIVHCQNKFVMLGMMLDALPLN